MRDLWWPTSGSVYSVFSVVKGIYHRFLRPLALALAIAAPISAADSRAGRGASAVQAPAFTVETGEIAGAKYTALIPRNWNRRIVLIAHGLRDAETPLVADLNPDALAYRTLVEEGWIVAKSSYRRNGVIVADAISDLDALRARLVARHGEPSRVLVEGDSMGGLIATLLAEREPEEMKGSSRQYDGAIAVDPGLGLIENNGTIGLSRRPNVPLIFVANQSELTGSQAYTTTAIPPSREFQPLFLRIARDGHVNVNQRERLAALRALNLWLDSGRAALPQQRRRRTPARQRRLRRAQQQQPQRAQPPQELEQGQRLREEAGPALVITQAVALGDRIAEADDVHIQIATGALMPGCGS